MKKKHTYTIPEFQSYFTSSRLWRHFAFSLLCFLLSPALSIHTNAQTGSSSGLADDEAIIWLATPGTGPILDCYVKEVTITSSVHRDGINLNEGATFQWTGPDGFSSDAKDIKVTKPGIYNIVAKAANGLTGKNAIEILGENYPKKFAGPDLNVHPSTKTVMLQGYSHGYYDISWEASNGGNIVSGGNTLNPTVDAPGTYTITLTQRLGGCIMQDAMVVTEAEEDTFTARIFSSPIRFTCPGPNHATLDGSAIFNDVTISNGITYQWSGPNGYYSNNKRVGVTEPGEYTLVVTDTIRNLTASASLVVDPPMQPTGSAGPDKVLTSQNTTVTLEGSGSESAVIWFASDGGNIVSGERTFNPVVDAPGTYTMRVTNIRTSCTFEDTVIVTRSEDVLSAQMTGGRPFLGCEGEPVAVGSYVIFNGYRILEGITYNWTGPNGFTSDKESILAEESGEYTLEVTHIATGLTVTTTEGISHMPKPEGSAGPDKVLTRENPTVSLEGSVVNPTSGYPIWEASNGGNIVSGNGSFNPVVDAPGTYTLIIRNPKFGCKFEDTVVVTREEEENTLTARVSTSGVPQLGCDPAHSIYLTGVATLDGENVVEGIIFQWNGPNGYTSNDKNVSVTEAGDYTLVVTHTALNLTATSEPLRVSRYTLPEGSAGPEKVLTCKNKTVTLEGSGHGMVQWRASDGGNIVSGSQTLNPVVDAPGTYTMELNLMRGGCVSYFVVRVTRENDLTVSATGGKLNNGNGTVQLKGSSTSQNVTYSWTGPGGYTSNQQNPVVSEAGDYTLTVSNGQGCTATTTVTVEAPKGLAKGQNDKDVRVYPNPVKDRAQIEFKLKNKENYVVNLYDMNGNLVREVAAGTTKTGGPLSIVFDASNLSEGLYLIRIISTSETKTIQVIVKK